MQDLSTYSLAKLRKLEVELIEELKKRHFLGISQAREQILHIARGAGLSVKDLLSKNPPKERDQASAPIKYRHPDDASLQWSGRGRRPEWVTEWIAAGNDIDDAKA